MKYLSLLLIALLSLSASASVHASGPTVGINTKLTITNTRLAAMEASTSILVKKYYYSKRFANDERCSKYKGIRTAGIVLLSVGGVTFGGGIAMAHIGIRSAIYGTLDTYTQVSLIAGGVVCSVFGFAMLATGTALTITGSVKYKKYCSSTGSTGSIRNFYISPSASGMGLAARF